MKFYKYLMQQKQPYCPRLFVIGLFFIGIIQFTFAADTLDLKKRKNIDYETKYNMIVCYTLIVTAKIK